MAIFINFKNINTGNLSRGGGVFIGQNNMLGWKSYTKSNRGINNGNHSPISNTKVILNDNDVFDAPVLNKESQAVKSKGEGIKTGDGQKFNTSDNQMDGPGSQEVHILHNGKKVYPKKWGKTTTTTTTTTSTTSTSTTMTFSSISICKSPKNVSRKYQNCSQDPHLVKNVHSRNQLMKKSKTNKITFGE